MMPLSSVQLAPLSVTVTGALTAGLATTGAAVQSAARSAGWESAPKINVNTNQRRRPDNTIEFMGMPFLRSGI